MALFDNLLTFGQKTDKQTVDKEVRTVETKPTSSLFDSVALGQNIVGVDTVITQSLTDHQPATEYKKSENNDKSISETIQAIEGSSDTPSYNASKNITAIPTIRGCKNTSALNKPIPFFMGKSFYTPSYIGQPYTTVSGELGEKLTYHALYMIGWNSLQVTDFCLGLKNILTDMIKANPHIEVKDNGGVSIYPEKVVQEDYNEELMHPNGASAYEATKISAVFGYKVEVEIQIDGLVGKSSEGDDIEREVKVLLEYSLDGGQTFQKWGENPFAVNSTTKGKKIVSTYDATTGECKFKGLSYTQMRFVATKTFGWNDVKDSPNRTIEIRIKRTTESSTDGNETDTITLNAMRTWCYDDVESDDQNVIIPQKPIIPALADKTTRVGFTIDITQDMYISELKEFNCRVQAKGRVWDKENKTWSSEFVASCNPASMALLALQSPMRGSEVYTDTQLDLESFGAFYEWCEDNPYEIIDEYGTEIGFTCNGVVTQTVKTSELLNNILACGRGVHILNGSTNKHGVWIEKAQTETKLILNNQNIVGEPANSKEFIDDISGVVIPFVNRMNYDQADQTYCLYEGKSPTDVDFKVETLNLPYQTVYDQIMKNGFFYLKKRKLQQEVWQRQVTVDGNRVNVGNLAELQDDTILVGIGDGAEVTELIEQGNNIVGIKTDGEFYVEDATKTYAICICETDTETKLKIVTEQVVITESGVYNEFTFTTPIAKTRTHKPAVGDNLSFGESDKVTYKAIVMGKSDNGDGIFELTMLPYVDAIYANDREVPEFVSKVSKPVIYNKKATVKVEDVLKTEQNVNNAVQSIKSGEGVLPPATPQNVSAIAEQNGIKFRCSYVSSSFTSTASMFEYKLTKGATSVVIESKTTNAEYIFDRQADGYPERSDIEDWSLSVRVQNIYGLWSEWSSGVLVDVDNYGTWHIPALTTGNVSKEEMDRTVLLRLSANQPSGLELYGNTKFKVSIKRVGITKAKTTDPDSDYRDVIFEPDADYYKPDLYSSAFDSEVSYKTDEVDGYETCRETYSQTLPLAGQSIDKAVNTVYSYRISAYNESGYETDAIEISATALCTAIRDIVKAKANYKELYIEKLSAIVANVGLINQGGFGDFSTWKNFWALSDIPSVDAGTTKDIIHGTFRVGDDNEYIKVSAVDSEGNEVNSIADFDHYKVEVKAGDISITNTGLNIGESGLSKGTYIYQDSNKTVRLALTSSGIVLQSLIEGSWIDLGRVTQDTYQNMFITNSTKYPEFGYTVNGSIVYHFDTGVLDETSTNLGNITTNGQIIDDIDSITGTKVFEGEMTVPIDTTKEYLIIQKGNSIVFDEYSKVTEKEVVVSVNELNTSARTNWGLTSTQINNKLFKLS